MNQSEKKYEVWVRLMGTTLSGWLKVVKTDDVVLIQWHETPIHNIDIPSSIIITRVICPFISL